jgi:hypothetical protein
MDSTPEDRAATRAAAARLGHLGGSATAARHDPKVYTALARAGMEKRFVDEVDPDRVLPEPERARRAAAARKAYYTELMAKARAGRAELRQARGA